MLSTTSSEPEESLLTCDTLTGFETRWDQLQADFVERPRQAVLNAEDLIRDIAEALVLSTSQRRAELDDVDTGSLRFPEELWISLQRCRSLMNVIELRQHSFGG